MALKTVAIIPKRGQPVQDTERALSQFLHNFADDFKNTMATYPPEQPWRSRAPKSGPRKGGARTGTYGDGWRNANPHFTRSSVTIINEVGYSAVVGGSRRQNPGQARVLAARGWPSVDDVAPAVVKRQLPKLSKALSTTVL